MRQFVEAALRIGHANWDAIEELLGDEPDSSIQPLLAAIEAAGLVIRDEPEIVISTDSDDPVNMYVREIGTVPRLTAAREAELLKIMPARAPRRTPRRTWLKRTCEFRSRSQGGTRMAVCTFWTSSKRVIMP
jgi:hypothetical protein